MADRHKTSKAAVGAKVAASSPTPSAPAPPPVEPEAQPSPAGITPSMAQFLEIKATHPDFRYQPIAAPEELGNGGRIQWVSGRPGETPEYAGTDFILVRDGRIAALYLFFDKFP